VIIAWFALLDHQPGFYAVLSSGHFHQQLFACGIKQTILAESDDAISNTGFSCRSINITCQLCS
jgi:hypothetical protein